MLKIYKYMNMLTYSIIYMSFSNIYSSYAPFDLVGGWHLAVSDIIRKIGSTLRLERGIRAQIAAFWSISNRSSCPLGFRSALRSVPGWVYPKWKITLGTERHGCQPKNRGKTSKMDDL